MPRSLAFAPNESASVGVETPAAAEGFVLRQSFPNPFSETVTIGYEIPDGGREVTLDIYDMQGRKVHTLWSGWRAGGTYSEAWDGHAVDGTPLGAGLYIYRLRAGAVVIAKKLLLF